MTIDSKDSRSYDYWFRLHIYKKKAWSQFLVTRSLCIGLRIARNVETSNAESPTPMYDLPHWHKTQEYVPVANAGIQHTY